MKDLFKTIKEVYEQKEENLKEGFLDRSKVLHMDKDNLFFIIQNSDGISIVVDRGISKGVAGSASSSRSDQGLKLDDYEFKGFADYMAMSPSHFRKFIKAVKKVKI